MALVRRFVIAVSVFAIFVAGAFTVFYVADIAQNDAPAEPQNVTNESIVQETNAYQFVDNATEEFTAGFNDSVTVYNNSSVELTEGDDYEWNSTDGTIKFLNSPKTQDGEPANISYTYFENTQQVKEVSGPITIIVDAIGRTAFMAGALGLVAVLLLFGGFVAQRFTGTSRTGKQRRNF